MKKSIVAFALVMGAMICSLPVTSALAASRDLIDATDPEAICEIAKGFGRATLGTDSEGDPKIDGRLDGTGYTVFFYGCNDDGKDCDDIQFVAGWSGYDVSIEQINQWNADKRFGKAYLDHEDDPILNMIVNIDYGVTVGNLEDSFKWWEIVLEEFKDEVLKD